jgi:hypothetical protein
MILTTCSCDRSRSRQHKERIVMELQRVLRFLRYAGVAAVVSASLLMTPAPAAASIHHAYQGRDEAFVSADHDMIWVGDHERDGNGVYAEYRGPTAVHGRIWDGNGSREGYGYAHVPVTSFRVCEDDWWWDSCSRWVYI